MKFLEDMKTRLIVRMLCKIAKARGHELDEIVGLVEEEWERA